MIRLRITTLGTSHGRPTHCRYNPATLLEIAQRAYLIDCGEPVAATLVRMEKDFSKLRAAFISHMHADHVGGLPVLIKLLGHNMVAPDHQFSVFMPPEGKYPLLNWLQAMLVPPDYVRFNLEVSGVIEDETVFEDEYATVTAARNGHMEGPAIAYGDLEWRLKANSFSYIFDILDRRIAFTGDLPADFRYLGELLEEPVDVLVMEMTHVAPENILPFIAEKRIGRLILTHIHDPWHDEGERELRGMCEKHLSFPFAIAHDGDEFEVE